MVPWTTGEIGIDLGLKDYLVTSEGLVVPNPKYLRKYESQLAKAQRRLSKNIKAEGLKTAS